MFTSSDEFLRDVCGLYSSEVVFLRSPKSSVNYFTVLSNALTRTLGNGVCPAQLIPETLVGVRRIYMS